MTKKNKHKACNLNKSDLVHIARGTLNVLKAVSISAMVMPALATSSGFFSKMKLRTIISPEKDGDKDDANKSTNELKPHSRMIFRARNSVLNILFHLGEGLCRINPFTVYHAVNTAWLESLEQRINRFDENKLSKNKKDQHDIDQTQGLFESSLPDALLQKKLKKTK